MKIFEQILKNINTFPNEIAFMNEKEPVYFEDICSEVKRVGNYFKKELKLPIGSRIGISSSNALFCICCLLGALLNGYDVCLIHSDYRECNIREMITSKQIEVYVGGKLSNNSIDYSTLFSYRDEDADIGAGNIGSLFIYSSGTTKDSKLISFNENCALNFLSYFNNEIEQRNISNLLLCSSVAFSLGLINVLYALMYRKPLVLSNKEDYFKNPFFLYSLIKKHSINALMVPTPLFLVITSNEFMLNQLNDSIRLFFVAGDRLFLNEDAISFFKEHHIDVINGYGTTETFGISSFLIDLDGINTDKEIPIGTPIPGVQYTIDDFGLIALHFDFPNILTKTNKDQFVPGDICKIDEAGNLILLGRADDIVKINGYKVNLKELENDIKRINLSIREVACLQYLDNEKNKQIGAVVVGDVSKETITKEMVRVLPNFMIPSKVIVVNELPYNDSFKRDNAKLRELLYE